MKFFNQSDCFDEEPRINEQAVKKLEFGKVLGKYF